MCIKSEVRTKHRTNIERKEFFRTNTLPVQKRRTRYDTEALDDGIFFRSTTERRCFWNEVLMKTCKNHHTSRVVNHKSDTAAATSGHFDVRTQKVYGGANQALATPPDRLSCHLTHLQSRDRSAAVRVGPAVSARHRRISTDRMS